MKLGTQTGSLVNHLMSNCSVKDIIPGVTGATTLSWTDRNACTVIALFKRGKYDYITVQEDKATRTDNLGMSDSQSYEYSRDEYGTKSTFRITDKGFVRVYIDHDSLRYKKTNGGLMIGRRDHHYDYSF